MPADSEDIEQARALAKQAHELVVGRDLDAALVTLDELLRAHGKASETDVREQVAWGLRTRAAVLEMMGKRYEALAAYEALLVHFGSGESAAIDETVAYARQRRHSIVIGGHA
jgi:hypothetical protein